MCFCSVSGVMIPAPWDSKVFLIVAYLWHIWPPHEIAILMGMTGKQVSPLPLKVPFCVATVVS